jgi:hypothetical protein
MLNKCSKYETHSAWIHHLARPVNVSGSSGSYDLEALTSEQRTSNLKVLRSLSYTRVGCPTTVGHLRFDPRTYTGGFIRHPRSLRHRRTRRFHQSRTRIRGRFWKTKLHNETITAGYPFIRCLRKDPHMHPFQLSANYFEDNPHYRLRLQSTPKSEVNR